MTLEQQVRRFTINFFLNICPLLWAGDSIGQHQTSHSSFILIACDYLHKCNFSKLLLISFSISALLKMERISARHKGDEQAVEMLKVRIILLIWRCVDRNKLGFFWQGWFRVFDPVQKNEPNTASIKVTPDMTPFDVMSAVLKTNNWSYCQVEKKICFCWLVMPDIKVPGCLIKFWRISHVSFLTLWCCEYSGPHPRVTKWLISTAKSEI